jgi:hypothetical protein
MGLFTVAQLFNKGSNRRQTHPWFLIERKKSLPFLIINVGQSENPCSHKQVVEKCSSVDRASSDNTENYFFWQIPELK